MDAAAEEEQFPAPVIPAVVRRKHVIVLPHVGSVAEIGGGKVGPVFQAGCLDEGGIQIHVHLVVENEQVGLGIVGAVEAFDYLAVFVAHRCAVLEDGHRILCIVVQIAGTQGVVVLVLELHQITTEASHVVVHHILKRCARKPRAVLDYAHMADGVDNVGVHVPQGRVAEKVGVVMEKARRTHHLSVALAIFLDKLGRLRADEHHPVRGTSVLCTGKPRRQESQQEKNQSPMRAEAHQLNFSAQTARAKLHSRNMGSITI